MGEVILVMGPSGIGKSTLASGLAKVLGGAFLEGDDFHPASNRRAMMAGRPLSDEDRWPWLTRLGEAVAETRRTSHVVFTCSALKRSYRSCLAESIGLHLTVFLTCPREIVAARMAERTHFMPGHLLNSQIQALEPPTAEEGALILDVSGPHDATLSRLVDEVRFRLPETFEPHPRLDSVHSPQFQGRNT